MAYQFFHFKLLILNSYFVICKNCIITVVWVFLNVNSFYIRIRDPRTAIDRSELVRDFQNFDGPGPVRSLDQDRTGFGPWIPEY